MSAEAIEHIRKYTFFHYIFKNLLSFLKRGLGHMHNDIFEWSLKLNTIHKCFLPV